MMKNLVFILLCLFFGYSQSIAQSVSLIQIGSTSSNAYGGIIATKHTLAYEPSLNLLVFGHRGGGNDGGGSGNQLYYDYSTDMGITWIKNLPMQVPDKQQWLRYPQVCIWNPKGNKGIDSAQVVMTGPFTAGTGWLGSYLTWTNLLWRINKNHSFLTCNDSPTKRIDYGSSAMCTINGGMAYVADRMDVGTFQTPVRHIIDFWKIVPDSKNNFTRSLKFTAAPTACAAVDTVSFNFDMAFGPDGNTGYISHTTADIVGQSAKDYSRTPILYKTTDAGETWQKQDFIDLHAIQLIMDSCTNMRYHTEKHPIVTNTRMVVDNMGRCHLFAEISSAYNDCADSIAYTIRNNEDRLNRFVVHFIINGSSVQTNFVYRNQNRDGTIGYYPSALDAQYQAARSADGTHIFFTAAQTEMVGNTSENNAPNLFAYAYRSTDHKYMPMRNLTIGTDAEASVLFPRLAPVVADNKAGHTLPITLMIPGIDIYKGGSISETIPPNFFYLSGLTINEADYTHNAPNIATALYYNYGRTPCRTDVPPCEALGK